MRYVKNFIGVTVLEEARNRIRAAYDRYDNVVVSFSGGKDSLCVLMLCYEVAIEERGMDKVQVLFLDEEVIHPNVIRFVDQFRQMPWIDMHWWAIPLKSHTYSLGVIRDYLQWDPERDPAAGGIGYVRDMPEWATTWTDLAPQVAAFQRRSKGKKFVEFDPREYISQHEANAVLAEGFRGSTLQLLGVRSTESLMRFRASMAGGHRGRDAWLNPNGAASTGKPIFDWYEGDVFRYIAECWEAGKITAKTPYAPIYEGQMWSGGVFRVGTAVTAEAAGRLGKLREADPELYEEVMRVFPHMAVHERYHEEFDEVAAADMGNIAEVDLDGLQEWCNERLDGRWRKKALYLVDRCRREPERYPLEYVVWTIVTGRYKAGYVPPAPSAPAIHKKWVGGNYVTVTEEEATP